MDPLTQGLVSLPSRFQILANHQSIFTAESALLYETSRASAMDLDSCTLMTRLRTNLQKVTKEQLAKKKMPNKRVSGGDSNFHLLQDFKMHL